MTILGIDYGTRWIGLALGNSKTRFAFPYKTLDREELSFPFMSTLCKNERVERLVIGLPMLWQGTRALQKEIEIFGATLRTHLKLPVEFVEEIFTSELAKILSPARARYSTHAQAATLILENYFQKFSISNYSN